MLKYPLNNKYSDLSQRFNIFINMKDLINQRIEKTNILLISSHNYQFIFNYKLNWETYVGIFEWLSILFLFFTWVLNWLYYSVN